MGDGDTGLAQKSQRLNKSYLEMSDDESEAEEEEDDEIENGAALPIILLDMAEEAFESNIKRADPDEFQKVIETLDKAKMLALNFFPEIKAMHEKAKTRLLAGTSEGKVPPGSAAVQISRVDMRFILSCIYTLHAKVASALNLHEGNETTIMLLREALIFYPRSVTANLLLARALHPSADSFEALGKVELCLRKAAGHQLPNSNNEDVLKEKDSQNAAKEALSLLLCQAGKMHDSFKYLRSSGFTWRLSKQVLAHQRDASAAVVDSSAYAKGEDHSIPKTALEHLHHVFRSDSPFWKEHSYDLSCNASRQVGYFSYQYVP